MTHRTSVRSLAAVAVPTLALSISASGQAYSVREISPAAAGVSGVEGVNAFGTTAVSTFGPDAAASWRKGVSSPLGPLVGDVISEARSVNDLGFVVGTSRPTPSLSKPVVWDPATGMARELPNFGLETGAAMDINRRGDIVGVIEVAQSFGDAFTRAVLWPASGGVINLGAPPQDLQPSEGVAINQRGDVAGNEVMETGDTAFFRPAGAESQRTFIGTLGGLFSLAEDMNDFGEIVGHSRDSAGVIDLPFRWRAATGTMTSLGTLRGFGAYALGTNNRGQVVGYDRGFASSTPDIAFVVNPGGAITNLNTLIAPGSGWELRRATAVNNAGIIVGLGRLNGRDAAFQLTPISPAARPPCFADLNRDLGVNTADLTQLLAEFGTSVFPGDGADVTGDGAVNTADLTFFLGAFGSACS